MDHQSTQDNRPRNPRRKTRTKMQIFQEVYLPFIVIAVAVIVIVGVVVAIARGGRDPGASTPSTSQQAQLKQQAATLLKQAEEMALNYDYDGALALLASFGGDPATFPEIQNATEHYLAIKQSMVSWLPNQVPNLSFHVLIEDMTAALADPTHGQSGTNRYNKNFVSTAEFSLILQRLYANNYVLVRLSDLYDSQLDATTGQTVFKEKALRLPAGKKPLLLTETHCNYYTYMIDTDRDGTPDADGAGFASKLLWDDGFYNECVSADGSTVYGAFDLVPILENFIALHPDFSYKGARAILAFSGYDGVFGYRVTDESLSSSDLEKERTEATALLQHLRDAGYTIACYTYYNVDYSVKTVKEIKEDILLWQQEIEPIVGDTDIMVFAQESDIGTSYSNNEKFRILHENGYRYFISSAPFLSVETGDGYVRHTRLSATASSMYHFASWFSDILNTGDLFDPQRGNIPK